MRLRLAVTFAAVMAVASALAPGAPAQVAGPEMLARNLGVRTVVGGLDQPTSMAFIGPDDMLVLEKATGRVQRVRGGAAQGTVLDLAVNFASERGLLGITLHPDFPEDPGVYLYWTCRTPGPSADPFFPDRRECDENGMLGDDTGDVSAVPLLGNRVDRFEWNGSGLEFDRNLISLRAFQHDGAPVPPNQGDAAQPPRGNHDGGVIDFGPDGKLYVIIGDVGRRGQMQNLPSGPTPTGLGPTVPDDQFGGPEPDDAHLTGVILRLNDDGSTPSDNPFHRVGAARGGEVGANIQKIFAYGVRNSFGMDFDPKSGRLWDQQNSDDAFDEINLVDPGMNGGWVQIMGPVDRIGEFKSIEVGRPGGLQQLRWPPTNIADSPAEALSRLFHLPGSFYSDPEFSWQFAVAPAAIGFVGGRGLGAQYEGDLFVGAARPMPENGYLFHFDISANRTRVGVRDRRLLDRVADNRERFGMTESETLLIGRNFGVGTDIEEGPNGNLYVVSLSNGAVYEIFSTARRPRSR
ncbi:MAG TPA: PQQ-dependent sugar dehydrogenase [Acidimicrobiales bacterium]|nr:PQQ-dependent sugar dehydrogenase [Acidimicrobiales bacterium]